MIANIFVNLPVENLDRALAFFTTVGFTFNPRFTDRNAACMVIGENMYAMLLRRDFFATFTPKPVADARAHTEVLVGLGLENREAVDVVVARAVAAGATTPMPARDHGFMYQHGFQDLDGHLWEVFYMDPAVAQSGPPA